MKSETIKELMEYLRREAKSADHSYHQWQKFSPGCAQAAYRSGMWYGFYYAEHAVRNALLKEYRESL